MYIDAFNRSLITSTLNLTNVYIWCIIFTGYGKAFTCCYWKSKAIHHGELNYIHIISFHLSSSVKLYQLIIFFYTLKEMDMRLASSETKYERKCVDYELVVRDLERERSLALGSSREDTPPATIPHLQSHLYVTSKECLAFLAQIRDILSSLGKCRIIEFISSHIHW